MLKVNVNCVNNHRHLQRHLYKLVSVRYLTEYDYQISCHTSIGTSIVIETIFYKNLQCCSNISKNVEDTISVIQIAYAPVLNHQLCDFNINAPVSRKPWG
jgi:hypothetical protein